LIRHGSRLLQTVGAILVLVGLAGIGWSFVPRAASIPSVPLDQLGLAADHKEQSEMIAASLPPFLMVGADGQDNASKNVRLWDAMLAVRGSHLPNVPQQIGDCVSWGAANAVNYLQAYQLVRGPPGFQFKEAYPPYIYGISRVQVGRKHGSNFRGDGSIGAYAAEGLRDYGVLRADAQDCPPYSGSIARLWGQRGAPEWAVTEAKQQLVKTIAQVRTADQARDAICNGYPVTIASRWWGTTRIETRDGRKVATRNTSWAHQQCLIGYDGSGANQYFYCLNSWGPNAHPAPLQGEPPGGYWIRFSDVDRICKEGDSWAISSFDGFPAETINWDDLLKRREARMPITSIGLEVEPLPEIEEVKMTGLLLFSSVLCVIIGATCFTLGGFGRGRIAALTLMALCSSLFVGSADAQQIDFAVALNRRTVPTQPGSQPRATVTTDEPDWNCALERRPVAQSHDELPSSWEQATIRQAVPPSAPSQQNAKAEKPSREQALFFTAPWCGFCKDQKEYLSRRIEPMGLTMNESPEADFRMVDVEKFRNLQATYRVSSLPVVVYLDKSGREVDRVVGFDPTRLKTPKLQKLK